MGGRVASFVADRLGRNHAVYLLASLFSVGLVVSGSAFPYPDDCKEAIPGKITVQVDNNISEAEGRELLSEFGLVVESVRSESLKFRLRVESKVDINKLRKDPQVERADFENYGFGPAKKKRRGVIIIFKESVTDAYAYRLVDSFPNAKVDRVYARVPRITQVSVPEGEEIEWLRMLASVSFVVDASRLCKSEFRIACEKFGGAIEIGRRGEERGCDLPEPAVAWESVLGDEQGECQRVNGAWTQFSTGCVDSCSFVQFQMCTAAFTAGCECGPARCWYGKMSEDGSWKSTCVDHPDWYQQVLSH